MNSANRFMESPLERAVKRLLHQVNHTMPKRNANEDLKFLSRKNTLMSRCI